MHIYPYAPTALMALILLKTGFVFLYFLTKGQANVRTECLFLFMAFDLKEPWGSDEWLLETPFS